MTITVSYEEFKLLLLIDKLFATNHKFDLLEAAIKREVYVANKGAQDVRSA